ncbi:prolyl oligopeptidase family serine peptidase [candidate division KSB1 bacterium]|nr:prolyl oligopeptidase family serine peptidase [candidate division KSB1 bacterium]
MKKRRREDIIHRVTERSGISMLFAALFCIYIQHVSPQAHCEQWPEEVIRIHYNSSIDHSRQPALFFAPQTDIAVPLLVALHTWSGDYMQPESIPYAEWCIKHQWAFIHPDFRGPNTHPIATGSEYAIQDIIDAVKYASSICEIDKQRIYLIGVSGGGHMALLMAAKVPDLWAGVSAWVPVVDLKVWYFESLERKPKYAADIENSVGGVPGSSALIDSSCAQRSPLTFLNHRLGVKLDINAGIHDGHEGSVPVSHAMRAFNAVALPGHRFSDREIDAIVRQESIPSHLYDPELNDSEYGDKKVLLRRHSNHSRITLFEGGHEIVFKAGLRWLAKQGQKGEESEENE